MVSAHSHDDEKAPERTTPQGTQREGVEHGHEGSDANLGAVIRWLGATALLMAFSLALVWVAFRWWAARATENDLLPSPLFATRQTPPEPRVLPNVADAPKYPDEMVRGPGELLQEFRKQEDADLQRYGLQDAGGQPLLPGSVVAAVVQQQTKGGKAPAIGTSIDALDLPMPSVASGGTSVENRLR